jgi:hypothetical protein
MKIKFKDSSLKDFILKKAFSAFLFLILFTSFATSSFAADELAGGQIMSKETRTYGKIEIRMWAEQRSGTTSTYYWWREGGTTCNTDWNEIDIETLSGRGVYQSNALWQINNQPACDYPYMSEGWHSNAATIFGRWIVFTLEWAPGSIKWYHDGVLDRTLTGTAANTIANPMKYCFNLWSQGPTSGWLGDLDMGRLAYDPVYQFVDYFKYYAWTGNGYAGTPTKTINFDNYADLTANFNISTWEFWSQSNSYVHWRADAVGVVDLGGGNGGLWLGLFLNGNQRPPAGAEIPGGGVTNPVLTTITVTPATATLTVGQTQQFTAAGKDQNGAAIAMTPTWTVTGGGTISASGLFTATTAGGPFTVRATSGTVSGTAAVTVNAVATPKAIPGVLQAEDYTAYNNAQPTQMRVATADGGTKIGYNDAGDWYDYSVNVAAAGNYTVDFRVANGAVAAGQFQLLKGAAVLTTVDVAPTGGWENFVTLTKTVTLTAGAQTLRINTVTAGVDYNWFDFKQVITPVLTTITLTPATATLTTGQTQLFAAAGKDQNGNAIAIAPTWTVTGGGTISNGGLFTATTAGGPFTVRATSGTVSGTAAVTVNAPATTIAIPGVLQAEDYTAYNNAQPTQMRVATTDGGTKMGYNDAGDWYDYNVNVATAGTYTLSFRVSNGAVAAGQFQLLKGAAVITTVDVAPTGGWEVFVTLTKTVTLTAGIQTLRIATVTAGVDYNWVNFQTACAPTALSAYSQINGGTWLQTATSTLDAGGSIVLGPQPATGGTWAWTGPNGFTANTREITLNNILTSQAGNYVATFTNTCGTNSSITNTITVNNAVSSIAIPGIVQAEDYVAYNNTENTQMRVATTDGGTKMGYNSAGDWYDYNVNVSSAGTYTVDFRVANGAGAAGQFQLLKGAAVITTVDVAPTGGWENFVTLTKTITLTAGVQTIRIYTVAAGVDYNWFEFKTAVSNPTTNSVAFNPPMSVESGDTYVIPVTYSSLTANEVQVAMLTNTFGWVVGQTQQVATGTGVLNFTITIPAGTAVGNTYIWQTEIRPVGGTWQQRYALAEKLNVQVVNLKNATVGINDHSFGNEISIYPVPVTNILNLKGVENVQKISVYNSVGQLLKQYQKGNETLFDIDVNELKSGIYFVELSNSKEKVTKKVIKK